MDKKELQNLIDRISLTGPEGIKKIKKVLKELNDGNGGGGGSSSGSMGEDEEYTIAQALNDLNDRIKELKSQIAQPEYIKLNLLDYGIDLGLDEFSPNQALWDALKECYEANTLIDVILVDHGNNTAKVLAFDCTQEDDNSPIVLNKVYYIADQSVFSLSEPE